MKKSIFALATAVACMFAFSACTPEEENQLLQLANDALDNEALGCIALKATNPQNGAFGANPQYILDYVTSGDSIKFNSAMCDTTFTYDDTVLYPGVLFLGGNIQTSPLHINFPLLGINLRDSTHTTYPISIPTGDFSFIDQLNENNWRYYLTNNNISVGHMMVIAVSDTGYYIGYDGTINNIEFTRVGTIINGTVDIDAFYVTRSQLGQLRNIPVIEREILTYYLPTVHFSGKIASRRTVWVRQAVNELENAQ